mgnify:CR=1 FL=1
MRLVCPNCGAQYDIANDAIPEGGRDVQCSSCANTWFQTERPTIANRARSELILSPRTKDAAASATPPRKGLDPSVSDILRERSVRYPEETQPPATQAETAPPAVDADETRRRIAQMTVAEGGTPAPQPAPKPAAIAAAATGAVVAGNAKADANLRSLPSIDDINATLRARSQASDMSGLTESEKQEAEKRRGFRWGFFLVLVVLALLVAPYFFQEQINANLPQLSEYMVTYVETVDSLRLWVNAQIQTLQGMMSGSEG